jgi:hypothetical protein
LVFLLIIPSFSIFLKGIPAYELSDFHQLPYFLETQVSEKDNIWANPEVFGEAILGVSFPKRAFDFFNCK